MYKGCVGTGVRRLCRWCGRCGARVVCGCGKDGASVRRGCGEGAVKVRWGGGKGVGMVAGGRWQLADGGCKPGCLTTWNSL